MEASQLLTCIPCPTTSPSDALQLLSTIMNQLDGSVVVDKLEEVARTFRQVYRDNKKLQEENENLKKQIKPKKEKPIRVQCPCKTAKGTQCRKFCIDGANTCKVHSKPLKSVKTPKPPRIKKQMCTGINIRGNPCRNKCIEEQTYCERHDPNAPPIVKKTKRNKKRETPMHTHAPDEKPTVRCILCETHGDMFDPFIVNHKIIETPGSMGYTLRSCIDKKNLLTL